MHSLFLALTHPCTYFSCIFKYLFLSLLSTFHYFSKFFSHTFISLTFCICFFLEPLNYFLFSYLFLNLIYFIVTFHLHCTNYSLQWSFLAHNFAFILQFLCSNFPCSSFCQILIFTLIFPSISCPYHLIFLAFYTSHFSRISLSCTHYFRNFTLRELTFSPTYFKCTFHFSTISVLTVSLYPFPFSKTSKYLIWDRILL